MNGPPIHWLPANFNGDFPPVDQALTDPDGLLAAGGRLNPEIIIKAYRQGIFPWYMEDQPILWWSPDPRCVLVPNKLHLSRSLKKTLNKDYYELRSNTAFRDVMLACAQPRNDQHGTWITQSMLDTYCALHEAGFAHSIECWHADQLAGGLYGIQLGRVFFGESMFSHMTDASKVALHYLCNTIKPEIIDAQVHSEHLESLGAECIPRAQFIELLKSHASD